MSFNLTMPKLSPTMEEGIIVRWHKKEGDFVRSGDIIFDVATDKSTVEYASLESGYLRQVIVKEGTSALINHPVAILTEQQNESFQKFVERTISTSTQLEPEDVAPHPEELLSPSSKPSSLFTPEPALKYFKFFKSDARASPLAKKLAKDKGIDLSTVRGSGPGGRILSQDVDLGQPDLPINFGYEKQPEDLPGKFCEEPLSPIRKTVTSRLQAAKSTIPHFYVSLEINAQRLIDIRDQLKEVGINLSLNDFIIRASALALREHPEINSGFDSLTQSIIRFKTIDLSFAVAVPPDGLITPIMRHADYKNLGEISVEVKSLARRAREGRLDREEYMGGSFTITNLGMYGVSSFIAILNPPQAAILAIGGVKSQPVVLEGKIVPGMVMNLTLSGDHRVFDGVLAAQFLKTVQKYLEHPAVLLI